jgi:ribosomal protein L37E
MKTKDVYVTSQVDGQRVAATLIQCPRCDGESFLIYVIGDDHTHIQCTECGETYCKGADACKAGSGAVAPREVGR